MYSHYHWDHLGDPSTFPHSTDVVVGPGFCEEFFPGGEPIPDSPIKWEYLENRKLREVIEAEFDQTFGGFPAHDFFGDGSFYLLHSPGVCFTISQSMQVRANVNASKHAIGHICGLARTTCNPDTFILMGGDIASHAGEFRPSKYIPLPAMIRPNPLNPASPTPCPGHIFEKIHPQKSGTSPYYRHGTWADGDSTAEDLPAAIASLEKLQVVDAWSSSVFVILAHDENVGEVLDFFPKAANCWKQLGWGDSARWMFLGDFREAVELEESPKPIMED